MAHTHKLVNGVKIDLTAEEISTIQNEEQNAIAAKEAEKAAKTKKDTEKASGKQKLKDLGLTDAEIKALTGA